MTASPTRDPGSMSIIDPVPAELTFECPRCHAQATEPFYGPCNTCRTDLRAHVAGEAREVAAADYVPKMNVTPNAVALKD